MGQSGRGMKLTAHLRLFTSLGMRGAIILPTKYVFMEWWFIKQGIHLHGVAVG